MTSPPLPKDFPQPSLNGGIPGAQPKLLARQISGRFVVEHRDREVRDRYVLCEDLAHQLMNYCAGKRSEHPSWSETQLLTKVGQGVRQKAFGWGLSPAETEWVLRRMNALTATSAREGNQ